MRSHEGQLTHVYSDKQRDATAEHVSSSYSAFRPAQDKAYLDMLKVVENQKAFYFSFDIDLTKRLQVVIGDKLRLG